MISRWLSMQALPVICWLAVCCSALSAQTPPVPSVSVPSKSALPLSAFEIAARAKGAPDIPGLNIVWLVPWGRLELAREWRNIVVHRSEGPAGSALRCAQMQSEKPDRRGATVWVETDGTVYWSIVEFAVPHHVRDGNRGDNKFIDNSTTFGQVTDDNSIGVEFVGNYPNVRRPPTEAQIAAWRILVRVMQTRYNIPNDRVFAHNWIDYKDRRYCEGCELAALARSQGVMAAAQQGGAERDIEQRGP
jgi:hypothetical protein